MLSASHPEELTELHTGLWMKCVSICKYGHRLDRGGGAEWTELEQSFITKQAPPLLGRVAWLQMWASGDTGQGQPASDSGYFHTELDTL